MTSKINWTRSTGQANIKSNTTKQKLVDLWNKEYQNKYWLVAWDKKCEKLLGDTVFLVLPQSVCLEYHYDISQAMKHYEPTDDFGTFAGIGYIIPPQDHTNIEE